MDEDGEPTAKAYLFFGASFKKPEGWSGVYSWHDVLARARGWLPEVRAGASFEERHAPWVESRRKLALEPCVVRYAGSACLPFACLRRSLLIADHISPILALPSLPHVTPDEVVELVEFCQFLEIEHGEFGWHLAAFYG